MFEHDNIVQMSSSTFFFPS